MKDFVRRSNLMVPITAVSTLLPLTGPSEGQEPDWTRIPDSVTLDLEDSVSHSLKADSRTLIKEAIREASRGSSEVFVRVNAPYLYADLEVSVWPGLTGIMLPKAESAGHVARASELMEEMEHRRGIEVGSLELIVLLESALGVWNAREIITASPRVTQVALGEIDLCSSLGIVPTEEYDPFVYARGRIVAEGTAAGIQPVGIAHPLGLLPTNASRDERLRLAMVGKDLGFKGAICPHSSWVGPANTAFTPTPELVEYYIQVREVFAQAIAAGTAAVPFAGRMLDVPVDEWAKVVLRLAAMCKARDEQKQEALSI